MKGQPTVWRVLKALLFLFLVILVVTVLIYGMAAFRVSQILSPEKNAQTYTCETSEKLFELRVNPGWVNPGEPASIRFTFRNTGSSTFAVEKLDGPVIDLIVPTSYFDDSKSAGTHPPGSTAALPVVRWSDTVSPDQVPHRLELKPGESYSIEWTYTPRIGHGVERFEGRVWHGHTDYDKCPGSIQVGLGP